MAGITVASYFDLETRDDELDICIAVRGVARLASELGVKPSLLYGGTSRGAISTHHLASLTDLTP